MVLNSAVQAWREVPSLLQFLLRQNYSSQTNKTKISNDFVLYIWEGILSQKEWGWF